MEHITQFFTLSVFTTHHAHLWAQEMYLNVGRGCRWFLSLNGPWALTIMEREPVILRYHKSLTYFFHIKNDRASKFLTTLLKVGLHDKSATRCARTLRNIYFTLCYEETVLKRKQRKKWLSVQKTL